jgi:quercetin dioxygenase-like cupin family protein
MALPNLLFLGGHRIAISQRITMSHPTIFRKERLRVPVNCAVSTVDVREITLAPGQQTGRHIHPCPVFGYIVEGTAILQLEAHESQTLPAGAVFYEPAGTVIARFDNLSETEQMKFIAFFLLQGNEPLIELLPVAKLDMP